MISRKAAEDLHRKTVQSSRDILALYELLEKTDGKVDNLTTNVADLDAKFEANSNQVNGRFDRLEALLAPPADEPATHDHGSVLRKPPEKKLGSLDG